jgi:hypothetical protein
MSLDRRERVRSALRLCRGTWVARASQIAMEGFLPLHIQKMSTSLWNGCEYVRASKKIGRPIQKFALSSAPNSAHQLSCAGHLPPDPARTPRGGAASFPNRGPFFMPSCAADRWPHAPPTWRRHSFRRAAAVRRLLEPLLPGPRFVRSEAPALVYGAPLAHPSPVNLPDGRCVRYADLQCNLRCDLSVARRSLKERAHFRPVASPRRTQWGIWRRRERF